MSDYLTYAWKLADFSGDLFGASKAKLAAPTLSQPATTSRLSGSAEMASFFITDENDADPTPCRQSGRSLSILTDKVTIDNVVYDAGQKIEIELVLSTDDVPAAKFIVGRIANPELNDNGDLLVFSTSPIRPGQEFRFTDVSDGPIRPDHTICFARGAQIDTPHGEIPVEELGTGDEVMTRDGGIAQIAWVGKRTLTGFELALHPHLRPIRIHQNALGPNRPAQDLIVSPQHRILIDDWRASMLFGEDEVLVPARSLLNDRDILIDRLQAGVDYYHVLLDTHELLSANGQWAESLFPSAEALETLTPGQREEIEAIKPGFFNGVSSQYTSVLPTMLHDVASALAA